MATNSLTPAQARVISDIRNKRVESRRSRRDDSYYWTVDGVRYPAATIRMMDKMEEAGLIKTRSESVRVVGMNVPRTAWVAYDTITEDVLSGIK